MYSYEEAYQESLIYFNGDELAVDVFLTKYALQDNNGNLLEKTPDDMHRRLANEFARIERKKFKQPLTEKEIFEYLQGFKYIVPQGSPMFGIGNNYVYQSLGNCYTIAPPYDSYAGIMWADQQLAQLMKRRAGVGILLDNIRPKGMITKNAAGTTDGIAVFMERYSNTTREVAQSGRRGALLEGLSVHHPEVETFINIKKDKTKVTGANISVLITDEFIHALNNDDEYEQRFPVDKNKPTIISKKVKAKYIWDQIIESVWESADPGILFIDNARNGSSSHCYHVTDPRFADQISNPCGEIIMGTDACRLLLLNLFSFVQDPFTPQATIDWGLLKKMSQIGQRLMDDMIDLEQEKMKKIIQKIKSDPEPDNIKFCELHMWKEYLDIMLKGRRTGLGITALGDMLAALNIKYGSDESIKTTEEIYKYIAIESMRSSCEMAKELGAFPLWDKKLEKDCQILNRILEQDNELKKLHEEYGRRNISLTTTAPAGSVSIETQSTSGIESVFSLEYTRRRKIKINGEKKPDFIDELGDWWEEYRVYHHHLDTWMKITGNDNIEESPYWKATSADIDWEKSIELQAAAQKWITHSISKTCNVPNEISKEIIDKIYRKACSSGLKGFTLYREGSKSGVLISNKQIIPKTHSPKRPKTLPCEVYHVTVKGTPYFVLLGLFNGEPYEIFAGENKNGRWVVPPNVKTGTITKKTRGKYHAEFEDGSELLPITAFCKEEEETITRLVSTSLRHGADISFLVHQLEKSSGDMQSFSKCIARALKRRIKDGTLISGEECPECGGKLMRTEGCICCQSCQFSRC